MTPTLTLTQRRIDQVRIGVEAQLVLVEVALMSFGLQLQAWTHLEVVLERAVSAAQRLGWTYNDFVAAAVESRTFDLPQVRPCLADVNENFGRLTLSIEQKDAGGAGVALKLLDESLATIVCVAGKGSL